MITLLPTIMFGFLADITCALFGHKTITSVNGNTTTYKCKRCPEVTILTNIGPFHYTIDIMKEHQNALGKSRNFRP